MKHNFFYLNDLVLILLPNNNNRIPSVLSTKTILKVQKAFVICASADFIETFKCSGISLFLLGPKNMWWLDATNMMIFGLDIGVLICCLGGFMAVYMVP